jgi:hypothetical protein
LLTGEQASALMMPDRLQKNWFSRQIFEAVLGVTNSLGCFRERAFKTFYSARREFWFFERHFKSFAPLMSALLQFLYVPLFLIVCSLVIASCFGC